jgi:glycosyltransferase involved in cell wall biosynthesis
MFIQPSFSKKASSATKMGEVLSMGKPIITNSGWGDIELFRNEINPFYVVDNFDETDYLLIIQKLLDNKKAKPEIPSNFALEYFSLENGVKKYFEVYRSLSS